MNRRDWLALVGSGLLSACSHERPALPAVFNGMGFERGHLLRDTHRRWPDATVSRRAGVLVAGAGITGLAAARALRLAGFDDAVVLELEDGPGGNSRGSELSGLPCAAGAHYLPVPPDSAPEVQGLLEELGLRRRESGRWVYEEQYLCHSPQERLYFKGAWQEGLLPVSEVGESTLERYRVFSRRVSEMQARLRFAIPLSQTPLSAELLSLDSMSFHQWLQREGLGDTQLLWYLDYCCRDDYGAGLVDVSAWAGIHYFASRHGFAAPGTDEAGEAAEAGLFTWPEGNGWLVDRLAAPLQGNRGQLYSGRLILRIEEQRQAVAVDVWDIGLQRVERWLVDQCVVALPLQVAARVVVSAPEFVQATALRWQHAAWVVANLHLNSPLTDRPGAAPAWDNVLYGTQSLGYVDNTHQRLDPRPGPTVLSFYRALGAGAAARRQLLELPAAHWRDLILQEYSVPHPDLLDRATGLAVTRFGHGMAVPVPGVLAHLQALPGARGVSGRTPVGVARTLSQGRLSFAHSDWSGYSIFEEAFTRGHDAGLHALRRLRGKAPEV
jgi:monoamine oxidase